jgi:hypothetical protein
VSAGTHQVDDRAEGLEVPLLGGDEWMFFEERNDPFDEGLGVT